MVHSKLKYLLLLLLTPFLIIPGEHDKQDVEICKSKFTFAVSKNLAELPISDVITEIGKSFLGVNYEAFTLEKPGDESLVVNLRGLDCTTFLENSFVFARLIKQGKTEFNDYLAELQYIRYREGKINGYPSRLHYFTDWIYENQKKGIVKDITKEIGGVAYTKKVSFMTENKNLYKQINGNAEYLKAIENTEREINSRKYFYIPKKDVAAAEAKIKNGDLIAITSSVNGLDINHVGIAVEVGGRIHFMHAPLVGSKVQITEVPLDKYLAGIKKHTGVMVLRPTEI
ncbi:MAG: xylanase [Ignavibacteriales bacterium]